MTQSPGVMVIDGTMKAASFWCRLLWEKVFGVAWLRVGEV